MEKVPAPLHLAASHEAGRSVILLEKTIGSKATGLYSLEVSDGFGNRSQSKGRFDADQHGILATVVLAAKAHAYLSVTLDDGRSYEEEWPSAQ